MKDSPSCGGKFMPKIPTIQVVFFPCVIFKI